MLRFVVLPTNKSGAQSDLQEDHWTQAREFPNDYFSAWWPQSSSSRIVMYFYYRCYNISPSYISLACGFYRVNSSTCSDINIDLLWPSDGTWRQRFGSTLVQVMACCLTAPSHYLDQCWLIISSCGFHLRAISHDMLKITIFEISLKITDLRLQTHLPGTNEIKCVLA